MPLWLSTDANTSAPKYDIIDNLNADGPTMYQNTTPAASYPDVAVGVFAVNANGMANSSGKAGAVTYPGWIKQTIGTGPVVSIAVANDGASYANLAVGVISNGSVNAQFHVVVNSTGHVQSVVVDNGGNGFINSTAVSVGSAANGVATFTIGGGLGYANGEVVTVSNGVINATGSITTNATGGITSIMLVAPYYAGQGFAAANTTRAVVAIATANGVNGNVVVATIGGGAGFVGTVTTGGRSGRVQYETLVASDSIAVTANNNWFQA